MKQFTLKMFTLSELSEEARLVAKKTLINSTSNELQRAVDRDGEIDNPDWHLWRMLEALENGLFMENGCQVPEDMRKLMEDI